MPGLWARKGGITQHLPAIKPGSIHITLGNTKGDVTALERPQHRGAGEAGRIGGWATAVAKVKHLASAWVERNGTEFILQIWELAKGMGQAQEQAGLMSFSGLAATSAESLSTAC